MKICIRLPNWLGDMVMSTAFVSAVRNSYPGAEITLIVKKGIHPLLVLFPAHQSSIIFSKEEYPGLSGAWRFGKALRKKEFDLFFSIPDSFSAAIMALGSGAKQRIGFRNELRSIALTHAYTKPKGLHRVEEYLSLLSKFCGSTMIPEVSLANHSTAGEYIVININSEASSRRLPMEKAVRLVNTVRAGLPYPIRLIGGKNDREFVNQVYAAIANKEGIMNIAGDTDLLKLTDVLGAAKLVLTTDSGPAHLANALGRPVVVLFGAGNEHNTAPWNKKGRSVIRLGKLSCEPCVRNECKLYGIPECLMQLDEMMILNEMKNLLNG